MPITARGEHDFSEKGYVKLLYFIEVNVINNNVIRQQQECNIIRLFIIRKCKIATFKLLYYSVGFEIMKRIKLSFQ